MEATFYNFDIKGDSKGSLVAIEASKNIPFEIKRLFYIFDTKNDITRGQHANKESKFILIPLNGSCKVRLFDGNSETTVSLSKNNSGLFIDRMIWKDMFDFSTDAVLLVLSNQLYNPDDYISDLETYKIMNEKVRDEETTIGKKVTLRKFRKKDIEKMHSWVNNPEITRYFSFGSTPRTIEDSQIFLQNQLDKEDDSYINWVIARSDDPELNYLGSVGLKNIDYINKKAEFNIVIADKKNHGKGYGTEATKLLLDYAFYTVGLHKVYLKVLDFNEGAIKAYEKSGFKFVAKLKEDVYRSGEFLDQIYMEAFCQKEGGRL